MTKITFPIITTDDNRFQLSVDLCIYTKDSITAACYKFSHLFFIHQALKGNNIEIIFESKDNNTITEEAVKQFCNELIDQQLRCNTEKQFGAIREMIVNEAFKPLNI
ncbi:MAG: His-Xaa-Ser system protein HxsD [Rikenellaceae bacterium]